MICPLSYIAQYLSQINTYYLCEQLLIALLSAYRYEGTKVKDDIAKSEAKTLSNAIKNAHKKPINEDDEVIRILATRSKLHLQAVYKHYKEISGKNLDEVINTRVNYSHNS